MLENGVIPGPRGEYRCGNNLLRYYMSGLLADKSSKCHRIILKKSSSYANGPFVLIPWLVFGGKSRYILVDSHDDVHR